VRQRRDPLQRIVLEHDTKLNSHLEPLQRGRSGSRAVLMHAALSIDVQAWKQVNDSCLYDDGQCLQCIECSNMACWLVFDW